MIFEEKKKDLLTYRNILCWYIWFQNINTFNLKQLLDSSSHFDSCHTGEIYGKDYFCPSWVRKAKPLEIVLVFSWFCCYTCRHHLTTHRISWKILFPSFFLSSLRLAFWSPSQPEPITVYGVHQGICEKIFRNISPARLPPWYLYSTGVPQFGQTWAKQAKDCPGNMRESDFHTPVLIFPLGAIDWTVDVFWV